MIICTKLYIVEKYEKNYFFVFLQALILYLIIFANSNTFGAIYEHHLGVLIVMGKISIF